MLKVVYITCVREVRNPHSQYVCVGHKQLIWGSAASLTRLPYVCANIDSVGYPIFLFRIFKCEFVIIVIFVFFNHLLWHFGRPIDMHLDHLWHPVIILLHLDIT